MIKAKVVNDDGFIISLRRETKSSLLPTGMIVNIPEMFIDFNIVTASVTEEEEDDRSTN